MFVVHVPGKYGVRDDLHIIKEQVYYEDGTSEPKLRAIKNFERPYWITGRSFRNHNSKKEWEEETKLDKYMCTQTDLRVDVARKLEIPWSKESLRKLAKSPYLYGCDISSTAIIKKGYMDQYPDYIKPYSVAGYDTETNIKDDTLLMATIALENKVYTVIREDFVEGIHNPIDKVKRAMYTYLSDYLNVDELDVEIELVENELEVAKKSIGKAHEWRPDFLAIWNMDFDVNVITDVCARAGYDPKYIFSEPSLPDVYKSFFYRQGAKNKVTASGKYVPINPAMQWHSVITPASFYVIDPMCVYKQLRIQKPEVPGGYGLDNILNKELGVRKLKFKEADRYSGEGWHAFMQENYPIEYIVYNQWDVLSMLELDKKTLDLKSSLPSFTGFSDFMNFNSQPKKIMDVLHYYLLDKGYVIATVGSRYDDDFEDDSKDVLGLDFWIVTLQAHMTVDNGLQLVNEDPSLLTNVRGYVYDSDAVSSYPSNTQACNVSKETTKREIINIEGVQELTFKHQNINIMSGGVNAIEYCNEMFGLPDMKEIVDLYMSEK